MKVDLTKHEIRIISDALTEYWQTAMKYSLNKTFRDSVSDVKIKFKTLKNK